MSTRSPITPAAAPMVDLLVDRARTSTRGAEAFGAPAGVVMRPTQFTVSALPLEGNTWWPDFSVTVDWSGVGDLWSVRRSRFVYDRDGVETWEPRPSERDDEFLARYRHDLPTAMELARRVAPLITVNGMTVADAKARLAAMPEAGR